MEFNKVSDKSLQYKLFISSITALPFSFLGVPFALLFIVSRQGSAYGVTAVVVLFIVAILAVFIFFFLIGAIGSLISYRALGYRMEENSLKLRKGLFSVNTKTVPFNKITNATFDQSFLQRLFKVGNVIIDQEDSEVWWKDVDRGTADKILNMISSKAHVQFVREK